MVHIYKWRDKTVIPIISKNDYGRSISLKNVIQSEDEVQEGVIIELSEKDFLSALDFFKDQCLK